MSDDLKPCPFCGVGASAEALVNFDGYHFVGCECGAEGPIADDMDEARAAWNKRPGEEALHAEIERLTGLLAPRNGMTFDEAKEHVSDRWGDVLRRLGE